MKRRIIIIATVAVIIAGTGVGIYAFLLNGSVQAMNVTQLSIGEKYLAELNYEKATATLEHVITVEPNNAEAYLALSKAYRYMGDLDAANETLENGYNATNSTVIKRELTELTRINSDVSGSPVVTEVKMIEIAGKSYSADITELILRECGLTDEDMNRLSEFDGLERLDISNNGITDISMVAKLTKLKKFYAANNAITDISALASLQSLEYIGLRDNNIANADLLFTLKNLKYLHISSNQLTSISNIGDSLQLLYLANNKIKNTSSLNNAKLLYYDISGNAGR